MKVGVGTWISDSAHVHESAIIAEGCTIAPCAKIEAGVKIFPRCSIGPHAYIGQGVIIGTGTQVGAYVDIGSRAIIKRNCYLGPYASIGDRAILKNYSIVGNNGIVYPRTEPITVSWNLEPEDLYYWGEGDLVEIGCQRRSLKEWLVNNEEIAKEFKLNSEQHRHYMEILLSIQDMIKPVE